MKVKTSSIRLIVAFALLLACEEDQSSLSTNRKSSSGLTYLESLERWEQLKAANGNSYTYTSRFISWAGFGNTTTIEVRNGEATSRSWTSFTMEGPDVYKTTGSYHEDKSHLNTHTEGKPALTIDELYQRCAKEYLTADTEHNTLTFETDETGLLSYCGYNPKNCMDDCYNGIDINTFEWID